MKAGRFISFAVFAIFMCLSACSGGSDEPIDPTPKPEVTKSEITIDSSIISNGLTFANDKGEQSISFSTNENWTLNIANTTSGVTWCTASATSGTKGSVTVKFTITENKDYEDRSVSVTIKSGTATKTFIITQKSTEALLVTSNKYEVNQEGGTIEIEVKATTDYKMEISEKANDWIKESSSRALTTHKHKLDIAINEESEKREGEIIFKSGDKVETVKIYQAGGAIILLSQDEYTISDVGETISVEIKSNVEFGVQMPDVDWITDEASSRGMSSHTLKYIVVANEEYDSRSAEIIFYDKNSDLKDTLKVIQAQKDAIVISEKIINVATEGETIEVKVNTNVDFEVQIPSEATWITQTNSRVLTEKRIYLNVTENTNTDSRKAEIVITNKSSQISESIIVEQAGAIPSASITILSYLVANNNLDDDLLTNIYSMFAGLAEMDKEATLLVYWDGKTVIGPNNSKHLILKYKTDGKGNINGVSVMDIYTFEDVLEVAEIVKEYNTQYSVEKKVMAQVMKDMVTQAPTDKIGLIFGSHGSSWLNTIYTRAFGQDGSGDDTILIPDMVEALNSVGQKFEFILFDACYMGTIEVAYSFRNICNYQLSSVMEVPAYGFPYEDFMPYLYEGDVENYKKVCQSYVDFYHDNYSMGKASWATVAFIDSKEVGNLVSEIKKEIVEHKDVLASYNTSHLQEYGKSSGPNIAYDLGQFIGDLNVGNMPTSFNTQMDKTILFKECLEEAFPKNYAVDADNFCGMGIYIPLANRSKWNEYFKTLEWYTASGWNEVTFNWDF